MVTTTLYTLSRGVSLFSSSLRRTQMSMKITLGEIINTISINLKKGNGLNFNLNQPFQSNNGHAKFVATRAPE